MKKDRDLAWLRKQTGLVLNFNPGQTDQDFTGDSDDPNGPIDYLINEAYSLEYEEALTECDPNHFMEQAQFTWASGTRVRELPGFLHDVQILRMDDITSTSPGEIIWVVDRGTNTEPTVSVYDRHSFSWGETGPGEDKTIQVFYLPEAQDMIAANDQPELIPYRYRQLIVWSAAIIGRTMANDDAPQSWVNHLMMWRQRFYLALSKGRPRMTNRAQVVPEGDYL